MKQDTVLVTAGRDPESNHGIINPPLYRASTIVFPTVEALEQAGRRVYHEPYYGRFGTPTTFALEDAMAAAEGGWRSTALASGKAAIVAVLTTFLRSGDHLLLTDSCYGPTRGLATGLLKGFGVETTFYDPLIGAGISDLIRPDTRMVFMESPGSQTFEVQDVPAIAAAARAAGAVAVIDNTWASPLFFKPFAHGVDISIQAATKYVVGHSDAMLGVVTATEEMHPRLHRGAGDLGACPGTEECWLALRGLRTLSVRLARHQETGIRLARWLSEQPEVAEVIHPALPGDAGHALWRRDFTGASGLFAVVLRQAPVEAVAAMLDGMTLFAMGWSWGGYESLIVPTDPAAMRTATRWDRAGPTLRIHAGLEDPDDLIADLERGLERFRRAAG